jgi:membrane protein YdbS with pleckstrin-like domain
MGSFIMGIFIFILWLIPLIAIGSSDKTQGGEKLAWLLAVVFISWFAWIFYLLLAPLKSGRYQH